MNLSKSLMLALFFFSFSTSFGQISDDEITQLADVSCECVNKNDLEGKSSEDIQTILGLCILEGLGKYPTIFEKVNIEDERSMENMGERIGVAMLNRCPDIMLQLAAGEIEEGVQEEQDDLFLTGTIQGIEGEQFTFVTLKTDAGRTVKLLWLGYFDGADQLAEISNKPDIKPKVTISYTTIECYSHRQKEYIARKMITGIDFEK